MNYEKKMTIKIFEIISLNGFNIFYVYNLR